MTHLDAAGAAFVAATGLHTGFQSAVSLVVYPALARVRPAHWRELHDRHTRTVTLPTAIIYTLVVATAVWLLVADHGPLEIAAAVVAVLPLLVTGLLARPLHRRLLRRDDAVLARLVTLDRARLVLAALALALGLVVVLR